MNRREIESKPQLRGKWCQFVLTLHGLFLAFQIRSEVATIKNGQEVDDGATSTLGASWGREYGIQIAVDKRHALHLEGTVVDFYDGLEKRGFTFENPNVVKSCGCGSSFSA